MEFRQSYRLTVNDHGKIELGEAVFKIPDKLEMKNCVGSYVNMDAIENIVHVTFIFSENNEVADK